MIRFNDIPKLRRQVIVILAALLCMSLMCAPHAFGVEADETPIDSSLYKSAFTKKSLTQFITTLNDGESTDPNANAQSAETSNSGETAMSLEPPESLNGYHTFQWEDGTVYAGMWKNGLAHGKGKLTYPDKSVLKGTFKENYIYSGTYTVKTKKGSYKLFIKKWYPYKAKIKTKKGFKYTGGFKNENLNGKGTAQYPRSGKYKGKFKNGKRNGKGTYTWKNGAKYTGLWKKDKMSGKGTYLYPTNSKAKKLVGKFAKNKPTGTCKYTLRNGKTYKTYWKNGKCVRVTR